MCTASIEQLSMKYNIQLMKPWSGTGTHTLQRLIIPNNHKTHEKRWQAINERSFVGCQTFTEAHVSCT